MARRQNEICMIVLDVGKSMHETITGGKPNIEHAKQAVKALIQQKLLFAANDEVSLIWFGTEGTDNPMNTRSGGYQHVTVKDQPEKSSVRLIEQLDEISEETPTQGDFTDALLVAMDIAIAHAGKRKALKRIFLLTDGAGEVPPENAAQAEDIIKGLSTNDIKLNVIGINFSEEEEAGDDERKHAGRTKAQVDNERLLRRIADEAEGAVIPISNALEMLAAFRARSVGQVAKMRADLEIGDVKLPVHTFAKTSTQNMPSLKKTTEDEHKVRMDRSYWNKASEDDEKQQVPDDHRSRAYFFGADKVTNVDNAALKFNNPDPGLVVLGFVKAESIPRHWFLSTVDTVVAEPGNQRAAVGLSGLIHALYEQKRVAICRYTKKANTHPLLVCLHPVVKADIECFYLNVLPFMEDFRQFTFSTFTTDVSKQPSGAQMQAAERLINKLDLDLLHGDDEDDEPAEALKPKLTFNPALQRCYQTLEGRAVDPSAPVAEIPPVISSYLAPDRALFEKAAAEVAEFKRVFGLAKIEEDETKKKKGKKRHWRDYLAAPEDDAKEKAEPVDHDGTKEIKLADIDSANVEHIGSADPVSDFNAMLKEGERRKDEAGAELITNAIRELSEMIKSLIRNSMGDFNYPKAADCIEALRKGCIQHDEAAKYNACLNEVRNLFMERRPDFWKLLAERELYPIDRTECTSDIEPDAARKFFEIGAAASSSLGLPRMSAPDESADVFQDLD